MDNMCNEENEKSDNYSDSSDEENSNAKINELVEKAKSSMIPETSRKLYEAQYAKFKEWCSQMKSEITHENLILAYFQKLSESYKASTLWATYTKLKTMLIFKENIDISKYLELQCFLKNKGKEHQVQKSKVFTSEETSKFLNDAPDEQFLLHKVALILGLHGCLRKQELINMNISDIKQQGLIYHVLIPKTKTGVSKSFYTSEEVYPIMNKYIQLRPKGMERFFVQYRNQKCTRQNVGKGNIGCIPQDIARFLNLLNANRYTGHAFRRTSATLVADKGVDLITLKRHGVWKSSTVAESYINESAQNKNRCQ